jgi:hypothetical protein
VAAGDERDRARLVDVGAQEGASHLGFGSRDGIEIVDSVDSDVGRAVDARPRNVHAAMSCRS